MIFSPFILTNQTASQMPHKPDIRKKMSLFSGPGRHISNETINATCKDKAKHIIGPLPVILTILPVKIAATPLHTPKHIITKPM